MNNDEPTTLPINSQITSRHPYAPEPTYPSPDLPISIAGRHGVFAPERYTGEPITLPAGITLRGLPEGYEAAAGPDNSLIVTPEKGWLERQEQMRDAHKVAMAAFHRGFNNAVHPVKREDTP